MGPVLVTGAAGHVGRRLVAALPGRLPAGTPVIAVDVRPPPAVPGVESLTLDIRASELADLVRERAVEVVVHLAAVVTPPPGASRQWLYDVDVAGTQNVLRACVAGGVRRFVYTSSGAAYGYHADNAPLLTEDAPLRGNEAFAYAWHKKLVEELLARHRAEHPELGQLVLRVSTILGRDVHNQITALFERPVVVGVRGADTPFCLVWDDDVVECLARGVTSDATGVYNLTGDGVLTLREIAAAMGHRYVALPERLLRRGLRALSRRGWTAYGPEQVEFLRYRPVLSTRRLHDELGFEPRSTRQAFELYRQARA